MAVVFTGLVDCRFHDRHGRQADRAVDAVHMMRAFLPGCQIKVGFTLGGDCWFSEC